MIYTNVLIIGKSGVGKSSLLNYIFDKELSSTGAGEPVTKEGIFTEELILNDDFTINISDTWGLEANKAEKWRKLIEEDIKKHDSCGINEWYHTILFCISAKSARVEKFEEEIINDLIREKNNVIIILTHSDFNNNSIDNGMREKIRTLGINNENIINISSVSKKLLTGKEIKKFGKEEILNAIKNNMWKTIFNKLSIKTDILIVQNMDNWYKSCIQYSNSEVKWYNRNSDNLMGKIEEYSKNQLKRQIEKLRKELEKNYNEAIKYYIELIKKYSYLNTEQYEDLDIELNFKLDFSEKLTDNIAFMIIPLINLFAATRIRDIRKESINKKLEEVKGEIIQKLKDKNKEELRKFKSDNILLLT